MTLPSLSTLRAQPLMLVISLLCILLFIVYLSVLSKYILNLNNAWLESKTKLTVQNQSLEIMIGELGYTGYIHHFKNYVIRRDIKYLAWMDESITNFEKHAKVLEQSLTSPEAKSALDIIVNTIEEYQSKRIYFTGEYDSYPTAELDNLIKVNDGPAAKAMDDLVKYMEISSFNAVERIQARQAEVQTFLSFGYLVLLAMILQTAAIYFGFSKSNKLTISLNKALGRVTASEKKLHEANVELENRVYERTLELKVAADTAQQANQAKGNFLAMMSHELRTPMNAVVGTLDLLAQEKLKLDQADLVATAKSSALSLVTILNDILDFSKIEMGKLELEYSNVNLYEIIDDVVSIFSPVAQSKGVILNVEQSHFMPMIAQSDQIRLRQILFNIMSNAIKFTEKNDGGEKRVSINCSLYSPNSNSVFLEFIISDSGIGISEEAIDKLFKPFTQAEISTQRKYGGTGLGLSICKALCDLFKGEINLESKIGVGTTLTVSIPYIAADQQVEMPVWDLKGTNILWEIDDNYPHPKVSDMLLFLLSLNANIIRPSRYDASLCKGDLIVFTTEKEFDVATYNNAPLIVFLDSQDDCFHLKKKEDTRLFYGLNELTFWRLYHLVSRASKDNQEQHDQNFQAIEASFKNLFEDLNIVNDSTVNSNPDEKAVLVVEDNPVNRKLISKQLEKLNVSYILAADGHEGISTLQKHHIWLILSDCHMPNMNGYEMTRQIRALENEKATVPIVAITGAAMKEDEQMCYSAGMDAIIKKPFQLTDLEKIINQYSEKHDQRNDSGH